MPLNGKSPPRKVNLWGLVGVTYGMVILTAVVAVGGYYWMQSHQPGLEQSEPDPTRRIKIGSVWMPLYPAASYSEATSSVEGSEERGTITQGSIRFASKDGPGAVMAFYTDRLKQTGFFTTVTGNVGGTVQGVKRGGKTSAVVKVVSEAEGSTGEIRTIDHADPKRP